jgi:hypothetical protein
MVSYDRKNIKPFKMNTPLPLNSKYTTNCRFVHDRYVALNALPKGGIIAEVGVLAGDLSEWLLKNIQPKELHLIDIFYGNDFPGRDRFKKKENEQFIINRFNQQLQEGQVKMHKGYSWEMLAAFPDLCFDWIYIDAAHDYESVKKDLDQAIKKVKPSGYIIMNDYIMYDHLANTKYGVVQATNEFCIEHGWEFIFFAFHPQLFCDVVLRKISA